MLEVGAVCGEVWLWGKALGARCPRALDRRVRLRCASTGGRGFSCGVVRARGSSLRILALLHVTSRITRVLPERNA